MSTVSYVRLKPLKLKGGTFNLGFPHIKYQKTGQRLLYITDTLTRDEVSNGKYFSGDIGLTISNAFDHAIKLGQKEPKDILITTTRVYKKRESLTEKDQADDIAKIFRRIYFLIKKFKPDTVIIAGNRDYKNFRRYAKFKLADNYRILNKPENQNDLLKFQGRLLPARFGDYRCKIMPMFGASQIASTNPKHFANTVQLLGFTVYGFETAIRGKNLYTLSDKKKVIQVNTIAKFDKFYKKLLKAKTPAIDTETDNLNRVYGNKLLCIQISLDGYIAYVIPFHHSETPFLPKELDYITKKLKWYFEFGPKIITVYQNAKFDITILFTMLGLRYYNQKIWDIMIGKMALDENTKFMRSAGLQGGYGLDVGASSYGGLEYYNTEIKKVDRANMARYTLEQIGSYGALDVTYPFQICRMQLQEAKRRGEDYKGYFKLVTELGSDIVYVFTEMERKGSLTDPPYISKLMAPNSELSQRLDAAKAEFIPNKAAIKANDLILEKIGVPKDGQGIFGTFNSKSWVLDLKKPSHQKALFYDVLGLEPLALKKDGSGKLDKKFVENYAGIPEVDMLQKYRGLEKLKNTYVDGIFKILMETLDGSIDYCLRASYTLVTIATWRTGCFAPSTPIYVLDSRGIIPICEVKEGDWVWSFNKKLQPEAVKVTWAGKTKKCKTLRVYFQGVAERKIVGQKGLNAPMKYLDCSPDHRFRLVNGKYKQAQNLKPHDRVLAIERRRAKKIAANYRTMNWTGMEKTVNRYFEHRIAVNAAKNMVVHHKNLIQDDNRPENLEQMSNEDHRGWHTNNESEQIKSKRRATRSKRYKAGVYDHIYANMPKGKDHPCYKTLNANFAIKVLWENAGRLTVLRDKYGWDYETVKKKINELGIDYWAIRKRFNGDKKFITDKMLKKASKMTNYGHAAKYLRVGHEKAKQLLAAYKNHEIIKVVNLHKKQWMYDISVSKNRNFIANGVCVHNCQHPNLQAIPSHGPLAKIIKRIFIAAFGSILVKVDFRVHEIRGWCNISKDYDIANSFSLGMYLNRKLRIMRGLDLELDQDLHDWLIENNWFDKKTEFKDKQKAAKRLGNRKKLKAAVDILLELESKGDLHKVNYELFFGVPAEDVTPEQRQGVKQVAFGVVYEKAATSLSRDVFKKEIRPIDREYIPKLLKLDPKSDKYEELLYEHRKALKPYREKAQKLIDTLFEKFKTGGGWIKSTQARSKKTLNAVSVFGAVRHLWGYLHQDSSAQASMHRKAVNSIVQGPSSNLGYTGAKIMLDITWKLIQRKIDLGYKHGNSVHDSLETVCKLTLLPLTLYYMEHSLTTQTHKRARETFDFNMIIGLEIDMEIGGSLSRMQKWDFSTASLLQIVAEEIDWMTTELGYELDKKHLLKCVKYNQSLVLPYRTKELEAQKDKLEPPEKMLLTPEIAATLKWMT